MSIKANAIDTHLSQTLVRRGFARIKRLKNS